LNTISDIFRKFKLDEDRYQRRKVFEA